MMEDSNLDNINLDKNLVKVRVIPLKFHSYK